MADSENWVVLPDYINHYRQAAFQQTVEDEIN